MLDRDGDKALLLSRYALDAKQYNAMNINITWEKCTLRTWLNDDFMNRAFTAAEQSAILLTNVDNSSIQCYSRWSTSGGNNTQDKVFLLSYAEANKYLGVTYDNSNNTKSRVAPTAYAISQGAWTSDSEKTMDGEAAGWWWLRSPGTNQDDARTSAPPAPSATTMSTAPSTTALSTSGGVLFAPLCGSILNLESSNLKSKTQQKGRCQMKI